MKCPLLNCMQELFSEKEKVSLLERCPRFRGVLRARGSTVQLQPSVDIIIVYVYLECRELSQVREDSSQSVQSLSSAILALQGIITKTKVPSSLSLSSLFLSGWFFSSSLWLVLLSKLSTVDTDRDLVLW